MSDQSQAARTFPPGSVTVRCRLDGPLVVELPPDAEALGVYLRVTDHQGHEYTLPSGKKAVALCRCNGTKTRPFCDGSHKTCGFVAGDTAPG
jgi:CDGSH-type Zn-finger protein